MTKTKMRLLQIVFLLFLSLSLVRGDNESWKQNIEYFEKVDLNCAKFYKNNDVIHSIQAWILPSGDVWMHGADTDFKDGHIDVRNNGFILTINRLDDEDFGVYYCIVDTGANGTSIVKIGINVDGPYFGPELMDEIKHDAMVGGIAAGCALVLLIILWLLCVYCTKTPAQPTVVIIKDDQNRLEAGNKPETVQMTKIGDSVYYNADEVVTPDNKPIVKEEKKSETLSSTNSGFYHSIDSIDRNKKATNTDPTNIDPADVYM